MNLSLRERTEEDERYIEFCLEDTEKITLNLIDKEETVFTRTFTFSDIFKPNTVYGIGINRLGKITYPFDLEKIALSRDGMSYFENTFYVSGGMSGVSVTIYFGDTIDDIYIRSIIPSVAKNIPYEAEDTVGNLDKWLIKKYPKAEEMFRRWNAKRMILAELDTNDILSAMEAQLDMLTHIVLKMQAGETVDIESFKNIYNQTCVQNIKSEEDCLKEMGEGKQKVRLAQQAYYYLRGGNV